MSGPWQNKIVGYGDELVDQLLANPHNFRGHPDDQQAWVKASLDDVGVIAPVIVNKTTGHLIDGHLRVTLAMREGQTRIPVCYVKLTPDQEKRILAVYDRSGAMAFEDKALLAALLDNMGDLDDSALGPMIQDMRDELPDDSAGDGAGQGEGGPDTYVIKYEIVFDGEDQQERWYKFLRWLKAEYPDQETIGERLFGHLAWVDGGA